jgi:hypothetical protein
VAAFNIIAAMGRAAANASRRLGLRQQGVWHKVLLRHGVQLDPQSPAARPTRVQIVVNRSKTTLIVQIVGDPRTTFFLIWREYRKCTYEPESPCSEMSSR